MKKIKLNYYPSLASFLDEQGIKWKTEANESISFEYKNEEMLFKIAYKFGIFVKEIENN
jgi:hypothetical protein